MSKFDYVNIYIDKITQKRGLGIFIDEIDYFLICFIEENNSDSDYQLYQEDEFTKTNISIKKEHLKVQTAILKLIDRYQSDTKVVAFLKNNYLVGNK